jgi:hypothetical protein
MQNGPGREPCRQPADSVLPIAERGGKIHDGVVERDRGELHRDNRTQIVEAEPGQLKVGTRDALRSMVNTGNRSNAVPSPRSSAGNRHVVSDAYGVR